MNLRSALLLSLVSLTPACGGSPEGVDDFEPPGAVRITGWGTATEYARATASTVDGDIPIPTEAITGVLNVRLLNKNGGFDYRPSVPLMLLVTPGDPSAVYWRRDPSSRWRGQVIGLERKRTTLTFVVLMEENGVTVFESAPVPVYFRE